MGLIYTHTYISTHTQAGSPETTEANWPLQTHRRAQEMLYFLNQKEVISSQCYNRLIMLKCSDIQPSTRKSAFALLLYDPHIFCRVLGCVLYFQMLKAFWFLYNKTNSTAQTHNNHHQTMQHRKIIDTLRGLEKKILCIWGKVVRAVIQHNE